MLEGNMQGADHVRADNMVGSGDGSSDGPGWKILEGSCDGVGDGQENVRADETM